MLGERLRALDYTDAGVAALLGPGRGTGRSDAASLVRRAGGDDPLATVFRLFALARPESRDDVRRALAGVDLDTLARGGLLEVDGAEVRALIGLTPIGNLLLASDAGDAMEGGPDFVLGRTPSTVSLLGSTIRRPAGRALDVGCGGGAQALAASAHCAAVVASDSNPRALAFARLNAALNEASNLDVRQGEWFEPAAGERFDLVLVNPPFVVSPDAAFVFRDAGLPGDAASRRAVAAAAEHLVEDGVAHLMCNWVHEPGDWAAPLREWTARSGCDAWALRYYSSDAVGYAAAWNDHLAERDPPSFEAALDRWLAYYAGLGIEAVGHGMIILRRRTARTNWFRAATVGGPPAGDPSAHGLRLFAVDEPGDPSTLLDARIVPVAGQHAEQLLVRGPTGYRTERVTVRVTPGLGLEATLDSAGARVLLGCDGRRTLRQAIAEVGAEPAGAEAAIRRLLELGLVEQA